MRLTRIRVCLAAGLIALATTAVTTTTVLAASPAAGASGPVVMVSCAGHGQVRPTGYDIGCVANELLAKLRWTSWRSVAFGGGVLKVDNCIPTCAQGTYVSYPILTVLWRAAPWPKHPGRQYFSRLTWIFTGNRPQHVSTAQTITLPSR
jgi:hypothetical protein